MLKHAFWQPQSLRVTFTNPAKDRVIKPAVKDLVELGLGVLNSETRHSALRLFGYFYRLICQNGAVLGEQYFDQRWVHRQQAKPVLNGAFASSMEKTLAEVHKTGEKLLGITKKSVSSETLYDLQEKLVEIIGKKPARELLSPFRHTRTLYDIYNAITQHAHQVKDGDRIHQLEKLGGWMVLHTN